MLIIGTSIALFSLIAASYLLFTRLRSTSLVDLILSSFISTTGFIILTGYVLSALRKIDRYEFWIGACILCLPLTLVIIIIIDRKALNTLIPSFHLNEKLRTITVSMTRYQGLIISPLVITFISLAVINLLVAIITVPNNVDGMTYHLARLAYYIKQGSMSVFGANFWAQEVHPVNMTVLHIYSYVLSGGNENLTQLVNYFSYIVAVVSVYGISRSLKLPVAGSVFSALVFSLLIECLMVSTTTQSEMVMTACTGCAVYFLLHYSNSRRLIHAIISGISVGMLLGIKSTGLLILPSLFVIGLHVAVILRHRGDGLLKSCGLILLSLLAGIILFTLPSGYIENYRRFANPLGPESVRSEHIYSDYTAQLILKNGMKNLGRYSLNFLNIDGMESIGLVHRANYFLKALPKTVFKAAGIRLDDPEETRIAFKYSKGSPAHEDLSYWGINGFALIFPLTLLALFKIKQVKGVGVFALAALVFMVVQSFSSMYDPWRGRYFISMGIFAAIPLNLIFDPGAKRGFLRRKWVTLGIKAYLMAVIIIGCISAFTAVLFRTNKALLPNSYVKSVIINTTNRPIYTMDRTMQITRNLPEIHEMLVNLDRLVPKNAIIALCTSGPEYEYPLFGKTLERTIIPINSLAGSKWAIPRDAAYLLFTDDCLVPVSGDILLAKRFHLREIYLRRLK